MLTGLLSKINLLIPQLISVYILGTTMGLRDKDSVLSAIGKPDRNFIFYTKEPTYDGNLAILHYYLDLKGVDLKPFFNILHSRRRPCANVVRFLKHNKGEDKTSVFKNAVDKSVKIFQTSLKARIEKYVNNNSTLKDALKELTAMSMLQPHDINYRFVQIQNKADLMDLGVVNQCGDNTCEVLQDPIVLEVIQQIAGNDAVFQYCVNQLQGAITRGGYKSTDKGNPFQDAILAYFQMFDGKKLSEISFIKAQISKFGSSSRTIDKRLEFWNPNLEEIQFNCKRIGTCEQLGKNSDLDALKVDSYFLRPHEWMHTDGCKMLASGQFPFILGVKISYRKLEKPVHDANLYSVEMNKFYVDNYKREDMNADTIKKKNAELRQAFFQQYPPQNIKGIIRVLFEYPNYLDASAPHMWFSDEIVEGCKIPTITIVIDQSNIETFLEPNTDNSENVLNLYLTTNYKQWGEIEEQKRGQKRKDFGK